MTSRFIARGWMRCRLAVGRWPFICLVLLAVAVLAADAVAQQPGAGPVDTITESTTVIAVEVPVTVVRQGEAVRDLEVEDFAVWVDGAATPILGFERVDLQVSRVGASPRANSAEPSEAARRHLLFVFDLAMTAPREVRRGLAAAREMLAAGLHPSDRVAVGVYGETIGARLVSGFTEERARTQLALRALSMVVSGPGGRRTVEKVQALVSEAGDLAGEGLRQLALEVPAYLVLQGGGVVDAQSLAGQALSMGAGGGGGGRAPAGVAETLADMERTYQQEIRPAQVRTKTLQFFETLGDLAAALRGIRGQRYLVLFSEGFEERLLEQGQVSGASQIKTVLDALAQAGWEVHAMAVGRQQSLAGRSMGFLADATGGHFYRNMQPAAALGRMIEQTSSAYVLTVQPTELGSPGSFHDIEVRLRDQRGEVRHRAGFHTPSNESFASVSFDALAVGGAVATWQDGGAIGIRMLAVAFKGQIDEGQIDEGQIDEGQPDERLAHGASEARVPLVIELAGRDLAKRAEGGPLQLIVDGYLLVPPTGAVPLFLQPLVLDPISHAAAFSADGGVKLFADVSLPAGEHRVRVVVRDPIRQDHTVATLTVSVPRFGAGMPQVLPPMVPEIEDRWLYVSQEASTLEVGPSFPFQFESRYFLPQVAPEIVAGEAMTVFLAAVDLPDDGAALRLVLETEAGVPIPNDRMHISGTTEHGTTEHGADGLIRVMASLDTAGLAPGHYRLRLVWSDAAAGVVREAWQGFSVVSGPPAPGPASG